jgi:hypothetical protein
MKIRFGPNSLDISLSDGSTDKKPPHAMPDQQNPKGFYVYGHYDAKGSLFYVGRGTGGRAWSLDRHNLWKRYVEKNLAGKFDVKIIADGMSADDADVYEARLIAENGDALVNWANMGRTTDYKLLERYHALRDANRKLINDTKTIEKSDLETAANNYKTAIENTGEYAFMDFEHGLVGQLLKDDCDEFGRCGEPLALERLTMCLIKLGRVSDAVDASAAYFSRYKRDLETQFAGRVKARIDKELDRRRGPKVSGPGNKVETSI